MDRQQCDEEFYQLMTHSCYGQTSGDRVTCLYWARNYFDAVSAYNKHIHSYFVGNNDCCKATMNRTLEGKRNFIAIGPQN